MRKPCRLAGGSPTPSPHQRASRPGNAAISTEQLASGPRVWVLGSQIGASPACSATVGACAEKAARWRTHTNFADNGANRRGMNSVGSCHSQRRQSWYSQMEGALVAELNVDAAYLLRVADAYGELAARVAQISPHAAVEVQRIADTHGPMGYPTAVGIVAGLAKAEGPVNAKVADFQTYSRRFVEHAATYTTQDHQGAHRYGTALDTTIVPAGHNLEPLPEGRVICTPMLGGFACSEFLPGGMIYHWLSPADLTGHWPDFPS